MSKSKLSFFIFICLFKTAMAQTGGKFQWVLPLQKSQIPIGAATPDFLAVRENKQVYLLSLKGEKRPLPYDSLSCDQGKFWNVWKDGLQGVFHLERGELIPPVYDRIMAVPKSESTWAFEVQKYGMNALVNDRNQLVLPYQKPRYAQLTYVGDTILAYIKHEVFKDVFADVFFVSKNGKVVPDAVAKAQIPAEFQRISSNQYVLALSQNGKTRRDTFVEAEKFVDDLALVRRDSLWGYLRRDGSWLLSPRFQLALPFDAAGHAVVKSKGKYGVVQKNGAFLIEPQFAFLKPSLPGFFEFKDKGKIGLVNTAGKTVLPAGNYAGFVSAGTACFAARSGDSLLVFRHDGSPVPLGKILECSNTLYDEGFLVKLKTLTSGYNGLRGVASPNGQWGIPAVLKGKVLERKHFFIAEAIADPCCLVGGLNINNNQPGKYLIFNRNGAPVLTTAVDAVPDNQDTPYLIYKLDKKFGIAASSDTRFKADFDELKSAGDGWVFVKKGNEWGALKWVE